MTSTGQTLMDIKTEIGSQIATAKSAVDRLIGSGFTTAAASGAYSEQFAQLSTGLTQVNDNLEPLGQFLKQYAESVVSMDDQFGAALRG
jgi:uncharacterized protein YukE